jgi:hypothetical protein
MIKMSLFYDFYTIFFILFLLISLLFELLKLPLKIEWMNINSENNSIDFLIKIE